MGEDGALRGERAVLRREREGYPEAFLRLKEPPACLYVVGDPAALQEGLAIVGARKATPYGRWCAGHFAEHAARRGVAVLSGGARGCDAAAHEGALGVGGTTVVFLGGGADRLYPAEHASLFQRVVDGGGAVVSEQEWETPPKPWMFRLRNRLIAGLAKATLIVEAGLPSGTFSTADEALAAGRDVLAVPGAITSRSSAGANRLISQGAHPIVDDDSFEDALFGIFGMLRQESDEGADSEKGRAVRRESEIVRAVCARATGMEELYDLARRLFGEQEARQRLMEELAAGSACGRIARYPDGTWGPAGR